MVRPEVETDEHRRLLAYLADQFVPLAFCHRPTFFGNRTGSRLSAGHSGRTRLPPNGGVRLNRLRRGSQIEQ